MQTIGKIFKILALGIAIFLLASCLKQTSGKTYNIGLSQCSDDAWRTKMNQEMRRELLFHPELSLEIRSADDNSVKQSADIDYFISKKVDLLIVAPNEANGVTDAVSRAYDAGIPVIVADRRVNGDKYTAFIGGDNYQVGVLVASFIVANLPDGGNIICINGLEGSTPAIQRQEGFLSVIAKNPQINIVSTIEGNWLKDVAEQKMDSVLALYPDVQAVPAQNDLMAIGAYNAAQKVGRNEDIWFVGVDALSGHGGGVEAIVDGKLDASVSYATVGDLLIKRANQILNNQSFQKDTVIESVLIDRESAEVMLYVSAEIDHNISTIEMLQSKIDVFWNAYDQQNVILSLILAFVALLIASLIYLLVVYKQKQVANQKLAKTTEELAKANTSKLAFYTNVSHDFRTPLTLVTDPLEQIDKIGSLNAQQEEYLKLARQNSRILLRLINQILDFRKIESKMFELKLVKVNIVECVNTWITSFALLAKKNHISLELNVEQGADYTIGVDVNLIERVFYNLMSNAFKFTPENGTINVKIWRDGNNSLFSISDNGLPITEEQSKNIFNDFYQVDTTHSDGSGIGLALVKNIVDLHNGVVELRHSDNSETMFVVSLPVVDNVESLPEAGVIRQISTEKVMIELKDDERLVDDNVSDEDQNIVLVIDDNFGIRKYLKSVMSEKYKVITAASGEEGVNKALQYVPTIIVCDVAMPGMDGFEVCERLKKETVTSHIPIILLTAYALDEQRIHGLENGAESYIAKPFKTEVLLAQMDSLIKNRFLIKNVYGESLSIHTQRVSPADDTFMQKLTSYIDDNISDSDLNVEDMGSDLGMSRAQLYRKVKSLTNYSPNEFVRNRRLKKARNLLLSKQYTISDVCYQTGFSSPSYFTKCYSDYFGETPTSTIKPDPAT